MYIPHAIYMCDFKNTSNENATIETQQTCLLRLKLKKILEYFITDCVCGYIRIQPCRHTGECACSLVILILILRQAHMYIFTGTYSRMIELGNTKVLQTCVH